MIRRALAATLPRCRFGCAAATVFVAVPAGCFCFPDDRKQWLCPQHFCKLVDSESPYQVLADVISLGWAR